MLMTSPMKTRTLCSRAGACFSWEKVVPMRVLKWKFPSRGFNSRLWEMDLFLKTRVTVLKTTRRTMVGSWQCLGPRERVLLIFKLIPKCHLGFGVLGLGVCMYVCHCWSWDQKFPLPVEGIARTYLQLPLQQWGAGNVYLLLLSSWKVNIAKNPIALVGL